MKSNNVFTNNIITVVMAAILLSSGSLLAQMTPPGNSLQFDGIDDYVTTTLWAHGGTFPSTIWTIECWVKGTHDPESSKMDGPIYSDQSFALLWDDLNESLRGVALVCTRPGSYSSASFGPLVGGVWYHLSATYDRFNLRAYKNGVLVNTTYAPNGGQQYFPRYPVTIGSHSIPSNGHFQGLVDEVRIWKVARTENEIRSNMNNVVSLSSPGLLAYYNFDQTRGETLPNLVSSDYTGRLYNGPTWAESYAMVVPAAAAATNVLKHSFTANWNAPQLGIVEKYFLDVSTDPNFNFFFPGYNNKDVGNNFNYNISEVNYGTVYYYRVRAYKASAEYGNYSAVITVVTLPNTLPIAKAGDDQTIDCAPRYYGYVTLNGSGSYDPDNDPIANYYWKDYTGRIIAEGVKPTIVFPPGVHSIYLIVKDAEGWPGESDEVIITINPDLIPPVPNVSPLRDVFGECSVTLIPPTATDNCSGTITATTTQPLIYSEQGTFTVTWKYTDTNGNSTEQNQKVIIKDNTPPKINVPEAFTTFRNSPDGYTGEIGAATATDNCDSAPIISNNAPQIFPLGITKVIWRAKDFNGNTSFGEQIVTIVTRPPVAEAGNDQIFDCAQKEGVLVNLDGSLSTDPDNDPLTYMWKEGEVIIASGINPTVLVADGIHNITLEVDDLLGGKATDLVIINVKVDKETPQIISPPNITVIANIKGGFTGDIGTAEATDNCDSNPVISNNSPSVFPLGITKVIWKAADFNSNSISAEQLITVNYFPIIVDVHPGSSENPINLKSKGVIPVAIITDNNFSAAGVNVASLKFGPAKTSPLKSNLEDVDSDGDLDLILHFDNLLTGILASDTKVDLIGLTKTEVDIKGSDNIKIVGKLKKEGSDEGMDENIPTIYVLHQNYPNPFNPETVIKYELPEASYITLKVYDVLGNEIVTLVSESNPTGTYTVTFNGSSFPSGVYFYKLIAGDFAETKKMILMR